MDAALRMFVYGLSEAAPQITWPYKYIHLCLAIDVAIRDSNSDSCATGSNGGSSRQTPQNTAKRTFMHTQMYA